MELLQFIDTPISVAALYFFIERDMKSLSERISRLEGAIFELRATRGV